MRRMDSGLDWRGRSGRGLGRRDAQGFVDGLEKDGHIDRLVNIANRAGFEGGVSIADRRARADDNDGDGAGIEKHLKTLQDDEAVTGGKTQIEKDEVGLLFASSADGGHSVASAGDFESGRLEPPGESGKLQVVILDD